MPHRALARLSNKLGPIFSLRLGRVSFIVVASPWLACEVLKTHDAALASPLPPRPPLRLIPLLWLLRRHLLPPGHYWRRDRRLYVFELLAPRRVTAFRLIRCQEVHRLLRSISSSATDSDDQAIDLSAGSSVASPLGGASPLPASSCQRCSRKHRQGPPSNPNPAAPFPSLPPPSCLLCRVARSVAFGRRFSTADFRLPEVLTGEQARPRLPPTAFVSFPRPLPATPSCPPRHDICHT